MSLNVQPRFRAAETGLPVAAPIQGKTSPTSVQTGVATKPVKEDDFSFWDLLDIVNPLQHIPVVGGIYRAVTGDKIHNFSRIAGGAVFGGVVGLGLGTINAIMVQESGRDMGQMALAQIGFGKTEKPAKADSPVDTRLADDMPPKKYTLFAQTVAPDQIPNAMRDALIKYQEMKSGGLVPPAGDEADQSRQKTNDRLRDRLPPDRLIRS